MAALNLQTNDVPTQLHHAFFENSAGFVLKPPELRLPAAGPWPPPRSQLRHITLRLISLHHLPKRSEARPLFSGQHSACHRSCCFILYTIYFGSQVV